MIELWFRKGFDTGVEVQNKEHNGEAVDGRAIWGQIENDISRLGLKDINLTDNESKELKYNMELNPIYTEMDRIIRHFRMSEFEFDPKSNHFFTQLKNLVQSKSNFNIQLNRVAQLGFNAGQLSVFIEKKTLNPDRLETITNFFKDNRLFDLNTYISPRIQSIINIKYFSGPISAESKKFEQYGGNIYHVKYLKYKTKYLELKNSN
jgi:hypothetical protein